MSIKIETHFNEKGVSILRSMQDTIRKCKRCKDLLTADQLSDEIEFHCLLIGCYLSNTDITQICSTALDEYNARHTDFSYDLSTDKGIKQNLGWYAENSVPDDTENDNLIYSLVEKGKKYLIKKAH